MNRNRKILGILLSLLIASQSLLAVAAPCSGNLLQIDTAHAQTADDPHAGHHMAAAEADDAGANCCDGGYCSMGGCLSISAAIISNLAVALPPSGTRAMSHNTSKAISHPESLYRPPIAR